MAILAVDSHTAPDRLTRIAMEPWIQPVTLSGQAIVLKLLSLDHGDALEEAVTDCRLWE